MNDQELIAEFLRREQEMSSCYDRLASQCLNVPVRDAFLTFFTLSHRTQTELCQTAQAKGWTSAQQASDSQISQAYDKYARQKPS